LDLWRVREDFELRIDPTQEIVSTDKASLNQALQKLLGRD
jgi:hypothetical protein